MRDADARDEGAAREEAPGAEPPKLDEVQRRLAEIQSRKRGRIRWHISKHTAEMAIGALVAADRPRRRGKSRRRKRKKRLL